MTNKPQKASLIGKAFAATRIPAVISNTADRLGRIGFLRLAFIVRHSLLLVLVALVLSGLAYRFFSSMNFWERTVCVLAAVLLLARTVIHLAERH